MQPPVAPDCKDIATIGCMRAWQQWKDRAKAAKLRSGKSDADLAEIISDLSSRKAGRAQVNRWFTGKREPTLSQFMLLCDELGADPCEILFGIADPNHKPPPASPHTPSRMPTRKAATLHQAPSPYKKV